MPIRTPLRVVLLVVLLSAGCISSMPVRKFDTGKPVAAPAKSHSILFAKVGSSMPAGQQIGTLALGVFCENNGIVRWTSANYSETAAMIARAFQNEAARAGYRVVKSEGGSLFEAPASWQADVLVGAVVKDVKFNICTVGFAKNVTSSGEASIEIEWQVFDQRSGRVVTSVTTGGSAKTERQAEGGGRAIYEAAAAAARNALARDQFVKALGVEERPAAEPDLAPLVVDVLASGDDLRSVPDAIDGVRRSVVSVKTESGLGSGFIVSPIGLVVTSAHVVERGPRVTVKLASGREVTGTVIRRHAATDVALIALEAGSYPAAPLGVSTALKAGSAVFAVGSPLGQEGTVTRGIVSAVRVEEGRRLIQSDVTVHAGSSGGPLLDEQGRVVGITRSGASLFGKFGVGMNEFVPIEEAWLGLHVRPRVVESSPAALPQR